MFPPVSRGGGWGGCKQFLTHDFPILYSPSSPTIITHRYMIVEIYIADLDIPDGQTIIYVFQLDIHRT